MTDQHLDAASLETREDAGEGNKGQVAFWRLQLDLSHKSEEKWRKRAQRVCDLYADEAALKDNDKTRRTTRFNILYSNTETLRPALLPSVPEPDVRRRFRDADPVGKIAASMLERVTETMCDMPYDGTDFAHVCWQAVQDFCLPGRAVTRVEYQTLFEKGQEKGQEKIAYQSVGCRHVQWPDFRRGPGKSWDEVNWIAFRHRLTRDQLVEISPKLGKLIELDLAPDEEDKPKDADPDAYMRADVWEIWDKDKKQIVWLAMSRHETPLKIEDDKLKLQGFFPIPRPLYAIGRTDSLVPVEMFRIYEDQARELDVVSRRIAALTRVLKARGVVAAQIGEFKKLANANDGEMITAEGGDAVGALSQGHGLDKYVWMWPIDTIVKVLEQLVIQREQIKGVIYELIGISDILRGQVDPREKAAQSTLKSQWGSRRLEDGRNEVQRYLRDLVRLKVELIAEHFEPEMLMMASGIKLPTQAEKQQAQQAVQMMQQQAHMAAQQQQQPPQPGRQPPQPQGPPQGLPPQLEGILKTPSIEEVMGLIRSDAMRTFRVDVETDQTIVGDEQEEKQQVSEFLKGTGEYWTVMGPLIQGGFPIETAKNLFLAAARRFKFGADVEDSLNAIGEQPMQPPQQDDGGAAALKAKTEADLAIKGKDEERAQADHQRNMQLKDGDLKIKGLDFEIAKLGAQVKAGEILVPQEAPDPLEREGKQVEIDVKRAALQKTQGEAEALSLENREKTDMQEAVAMAGQAAQVFKVAVAEITQITQALGQQTQALGQQVQELKEVSEAPREIVRDASGRAAAVRVNGRDRAIKRDANGRVAGLH